MRAFTHFFMWTQVLMAGAVFLDMAASDDASVKSSMFVSLMWVVLYCSLFILFPVRALQSFNKEEKANSLELVLLTKLSGARLVFGKYFAIVSLAGLVIVSLLPYLFLQYFLRGSDIIESLTELYLLCLASAITIAVTLLNSAMARGRPVAIFFMIGLVMLAYIARIVISAVYSSGRWFTSLPAFTIGILLIYAAITILQLLMIAASRIAPIYENYTSVKRLIGLLVLALTSLFVILEPAGLELVLILCFVSILPIIVSSCFEQMHPLLGLRLQYKRFTPWMTYAGWPQGMVYALLIILWLNAMVFYTGLVSISSTQRFPEFCFFAFVGLILPRALMLTFPKIFGRTFFAYSIIQLVTLIIGTALSAASYRVSGFSIIPSFFPLLTAIYFLDGSTYMLNKISMPVAGTIAVITILLLAIQAFREVRQTIAAGRLALLSSEKKGSGETAGGVSQAAAQPAAAPANPATLTTE